MAENNVKIDLAKALARLASLSYQNKYIAEGTTERYVLPEELIDDAEAMIDKLLSKDSLQFSEDQLLALNNVCELISNIPPEKISFSSRDEAIHAIQFSAEWHDLRNMAKSALEKLNLDHSIKDID